MTRRPIVAGWVAVAAATALAACSSSHAISQADVQSKVAAAEQSTYPDLKVGAVACAGGVATTVGAMTTCTIDVGGARVPLAATVTSVSDDSAHLDFQPTRPAISFASAQTYLASKINGLTGGTDAAADCRTRNGGVDVLVTTVGATFTCAFTESGKQHTATLQVTDLAGDGTVVAIDGHALAPPSSASPAAASPATP